MTTDKTIEEMNAAIAVFDGWEKVTVGYYGQHTGEEDDETPWQVENRAWLDHMEIESVGTYWVKVKENKVYDGHEIKYHEDWNQLMAVGKKIRDYLQEQLRARPPHTATNGDLLEVDISCAITCYDKAKAHKAIYDFIQWFNTTTTKQKD